MASDKRTGPRNTPTETRPIVKPLQPTLPIVTTGNDGGRDDEVLCIEQNEVLDATGLLDAGEQ